MADNSQRRFQALKADQKAHYAFEMILVAIETLRENVISSFGEYGDRITDKTLGRYIREDVSDGVNCIGTLNTKLKFMFTTGESRRQNAPWILREAAKEADRQTKHKETVARG